MVSPTFTNMTKPDINPDSFYDLDVRLGVITSAEPIPKNKGYLKLVANFGEPIGDRTIVTNLGKHFTPGDFIASLMPFVLNLPSRTTAGIVSEGMILASKNLVEGTYSLLPSNSGTPGDVVI